MPYSHKPKTRSPQSLKDNIDEWPTLVKLIYMRYALLGLILIYLILLAGTDGWSFDNQQLYIFFFCLPEPNSDTHIDES